MPGGGNMEVQYGAEKETQIRDLNKEPPIRNPNKETKKGTSNKRPE